MKAPPGFLARLRLELYTAMQRLEGDEHNEFRVLLDEVVDCMREQPAPRRVEQPEIGRLRSLLIEACDAWEAAEVLLEGDRGERSTEMARIAEIRKMEGL